MATGFRFASNIVKHNTYGIFGNNVGTGNPAIATYFPGSVIVGNAMAGGNAERSTRPATCSRRSRA